MGGLGGVGDLGGLGGEEVGDSEGGRTMVSKSMTLAYMGCVSYPPSCARREWVGQEPQSQ